MKKNLRILTVPALRPVLDRMELPPGAEWLYAADDSAGVAEQLFRVQPDAVIMPLSMRDADAVEIIRAYRMLLADRLTYFAVITPIATAELLRELRCCGADKVIRMPVTVRDIAGVLEELSQRNTRLSAKKPDAGIHEMHELHYRNGAGRGEPPDGCLILDGMLVSLGFSRCEATEFLRYAVLLVLQAHGRRLPVTGFIYPSVAREFGVTPSGAERRIRKAIAGVWNSGNGAMIRAYFGGTVDTSRGRPSNSEFIAMLADRIRLEMASEQPVVPPSR